MIQAINTSALEGEECGHGAQDSFDYKIWREISIATYWNFTTTRRKGLFYICPNENRNNIDLRKEMVCSHSEMNESSLQCGRARSNSEPVPQRQRRSSIVLTPAVLDEYARGNEDAAMFKRQYEQAYYNVYGSHLPRNNAAATDMTIPWSDQTVYSRYSSDPRLNAMGFFDFRRKSFSRCSWICFFFFTMFVAAAVNLTQKIHKEIIHESFGASSGLADGLWGNSSDR